MAFVGTAPRKAILFGEHYVVHGAAALCVPIEPGTRVEIERAGGKVGVRLISSIGDDFFSQEEAGTNEKFENLRVAYCGFLAETKADEMPFVARFSAQVSQKGTGMSASFATSFLRALCAAYGKKLSKKKFFEIVQKAEEIAHGARASGIDATTVMEGKPVLFEKKFEPVRFVFKDAKVELPKGSRLLLCDTFEGVRSKTSELVEKFAKSYGVQGAANTAQRKKIAADFGQVFKKAIENLKKTGSIVELGSCMNANHGLLAAHGASSAGIEKCREIAFAHGAYGAKLTGAGGEGGAVLVLCGEKAVGKIVQALEDANFSAAEIKIAGKI
ncbi:Mevalonate kinase [Candidatus Anstonella stagnisolia]|nr:Mevalonate kinase [Candidatus Anstonella stagnisolia]